MKMNQKQDETDGISAPICDMLKAYRKKSKLRLHMPGHGGNADFCRDADIDVTELEATDNLFSPINAIRESERICSELFGSDDSFYSCGGATLCIQAALMACIRLITEKKGKSSPITLICDRNSHKSVLNSAALLDLAPKWYFPTKEKPLPDEKADIVLITTASYYGQLLFHDRADMQTDKSTFYIADNSHGGHLAFYKEKRHPLSLGFDFVIDSLHKTLPVNTGGAVLHTGAALREKLGFDREKIRETVISSMSLFGSTSPSFLILSSIDAAVARIRCDLENGISKTYRSSARVISELGQALSRYCGFFTDDPQRAVLRGKHNFEEINALLEANGIFAEFYTNCALVLLFPFGFDEKDARLLKSVLLPYFEDEKGREEKAYDTTNCDNSLKFSSDRETFEGRLPETVLTPRAAMFAPSEKLPIGDALGRISAELYAPYPPGIPLIVPGEVFGIAEVKALRDDFPTVKVLIQANK